MSSLKLVLAYSPQDQVLIEEFLRHLSQLTREQMIELWDERQVSPGEARIQQIDSHLVAADIIVLALSKDMFVSHYGTDRILTTMLARQAEGAVSVIPLLVRPVDWQSSLVGHLQPLPRNGEPVASWRDRDGGWLEVVDGLRCIVEERRRVMATSSILSSEFTLDELRRIVALWPNRVSILDSLKKGSTASTALQFATTLAFAAQRQQLLNDLLSHAQKFNPRATSSGLGSAPAPPTSVTSAASKQHGIFEYYPSWVIVLFFLPASIVLVVVAIVSILVLAPSVGNLDPVQALIFVAAVIVILLASLAVAFMIAIRLSKSVLRTLQHSSSPTLRRFVAVVAGPRKQVQ